jgi:hypothetical protein
MVAHIVNEPLGPGPIAIKELAQTHPLRGPSAITAESAPRQTAPRLEDSPIQFEVRADAFSICEVPGWILEIARMREGQAGSHPPVADHADALPIRRAGVADLDGHLRGHA